MFLLRSSCVDGLIRIVTRSLHIKMHMLQDSRSATDDQKVRFSVQDLRELRPTILMAKKMGAGLG